MKTTLAILALLIVTTVFAEPSPSASPTVFAPVLTTGTLTKISSSYPSMDVNREPVVTKIGEHTWRITFKP